MDTKPLMLPVDRHSISAHRQQVTGTRVLAASAAGYCLACRRKKVKRTIREKQVYYDTPKGKYRSLYTRVKRNSREITFTLEEFLDWYKGRILVCFYCGIPVKERGKTADSFTFDRADNDKSYTLDNIRIACRKCNTAKGAWFTEKQMLQIAGFYFGGSNKDLCIKA